MGADQQRQTLMADLEFDALVANLPVRSPNSAATRNWQPPSVADLNAVLDRVEVVGMIGCGSMGAVYRGRQPHLDRDVAVKVLPREWNGCPDLVERFQQEARALAGLRHPNIVMTHDFGQAADGRWYVINELIDGVSLRSLIDSGPVHPEWAIGIAVDLCRALQHAHDQRLIHRDVKPGNVLIDASGRAILADFGVVAFANRAESCDLTDEGGFVGTTGYAAPEQMRGQHDVDLRADLFSLGVVLYEMLTAQRPVGSWTPASRMSPGVPRRVDQIIGQLLAPVPADRYDNAMNVATDLEACRPRSSRRHSPPWLTIGGLALLAVCAAVAIAKW